MIIILCFLLLHWYLSLFSQSFFQHRYAAHQAFRMNKFWERFFFVFAYITQGSSYMSPKVYSIMHRMHHAYTDTDHDPHSPAFDENVFSMMLRTCKIYVKILHNKLNVEDTFVKNTITWIWFDKWANSWYSRGLWSVIYLSFYVTFAPFLWCYVLIPIHIAIGPIHGVIINWFGHKYGGVNFQTNNSSKNLFKLDLLMLGEGYHNNHHKYPSRTNFAVKKGEIDVCYHLIRLFNEIGIVKIRRPGIS